LESLFFSTLIDHPNLIISLQEIKKFNGSFAELKTVWGQAELWADLSCFDGVSAGRQDPVAQAAADFLATATSRVQAENERLQTLKQVKEEAAHLDNLIQKQVRGLIQNRCWDVCSMRIYT
jgi:hypothetical protein